MPEALDLTGVLAMKRRRSLDPIYLPSDDRFCCSIAEDLAASAGTRGLAMFVAQIIDGRDSFFLQFRAIDEGEAVVGSPGQGLMTTVADQAIFYCPGCGTELADFYNLNKELLRREGLKLRGADG